MRLLAWALCLLAAVPVSAREITGASYHGPTSRYAHGVLGDDEEWDELRIEVSRSAGKDDGLFQGYLSLTYSFDLPDELVFEDTRPRLWDVTGDGKPEVVVVQSHANLGARLVIIGLTDAEKPQMIAATPFIGTRNRWLAPVAAADFDGDGFIEIAYVDRPHLYKTLRVWRLKQGAFSEIATLKGVSNHRIGEDYISGGMRDCGAGPEMIVASGDWSKLLAVQLSEGRLTAKPIGSHQGAGSFQTALECS